MALAPSSFWSVYDPPVLSPVPWLAKLRPLGPGFFRPVMAVMKRSVESWVRPWHEFRHELGLPLTRRNPIFDGQFSPSMTVGMFSPLLGKPQPDWPPNTHVTGFLFYDGVEHSTLQPELASFLQKGEPPIVFTLGSSAVMDAGDFYRQSIEATKRLGRRAILLIGRDPRNRPKEVLPESILAADYVPYSQVLPRAGAIVHQGGVGTTAQALRAGRPMLVMPFGFDQPDNAARVEAIGVGRVISRKHYTAHSVAGELKLLLETPQYAKTASEVGELIAREDGVGNACRAIEAGLGKVLAESLAHSVGRKI